MDLKLSRSFITSILFLAGALLFLMAVVQPVPVQACQHISRTAEGGTEVRIIVGQLYIRDAPHGNIIGVLLVGQTVTVIEYAETDAYLWGRHTRGGWSALHTTDCALEYAEPVEPLAEGDRDAAPADGAGLPADSVGPPTDGAGLPADGAGSDETPPADAPGTAPPPAPALFGSDNLCHTVWTFCNTGTPEQQAYFWRLGWFTAAVQRGEVPAVSPEEYATGEISPEPEPISPEPEPISPEPEPMSPEATAEP